MKKVNHKVLMRGSFPFLLERDKCVPRPSSSPRLGWLHLIGARIAIKVLQGGGRGLAMQEFGNLCPHPTILQLHRKESVGSHRIEVLGHSVIVALEPYPHFSVILPSSCW